MFSAIISSPPYFVFSSIPIMCMLVCLMLLYIFLHLCSFVLILFSFDFLGGLIVSIDFKYAILSSASSNILLHTIGFSYLNYCSFSIQNFYLALLFEVIFYFFIDNLYLTIHCHHSYCYSKHGFL